MHNCAARRAKYSRRLLSILAQKSHTKQLNKQRFMVMTSQLRKVWYDIDNIVEVIKKKNGAHTHVRTTVQFDE